MVHHGTNGKRTLFERESELAAVDDALSELCALSRDGSEPPGRPRGALIAFAGRAGLGKTSLLAETRHRAAAKGCTVALARGSDQEQRVAFHVARQLVQPLLAPVPDADCAKSSAVGTPSSAPPSASAPLRTAPRPTRRACATGWTGCSPISRCSAPRWWS
ncbi:hypothetical protein GCM10010277_30300 [Streptomyces longisporoflavus]|nr:hypothetical protein GCM10010277_30300 [Streptomyces longisporoflavus]